jgi:hypothetical protein
VCPKRWGGSLLVETVSDVLVPTHVKRKGIGTIQGLGAQENGALQSREAHTSNRRKILLVCGEVGPREPLDVTAATITNRRTLYVGSSPLLCAQCTVGIIED